MLFWRSLSIHCLIASCEVVSQSLMKLSSGSRDSLGRIWGWMKIFACMHAGRGRGPRLFHDFGRNNFRISHGIIVK